MRFSKTAIIFILILTGAFVVGAQDTVKLPDTEVGKRFAGYIKAFNSGDEKVMRDFLSKNISREGLQRRSVDERIDVYRQMRGNFTSFDVHSLLETSESAITALVHTGKGEWIQLGFICEENPSHMMQAIRIEDAQPPAAGAATNAAPPKKMTEAEALASVETLLEDLVKKDEFSGVALIAKEGKPIFEKAYGLASREYNVPNRVDTKFNLGSINKIITQTAIAQLVEQGKISLDDHINRFLPDYPNKDAAAKVTVRQLLTMTSGIGDFFGADYQGTPKDRIRNLKDYLPFFASNPLLFEPGTGEQYSNGGYVVLGLIIEKITGGDYDAYVNEQIFKPTGMLNTGYFDADAVVENMASGYTRNDGRGQNGRRNNMYTRPAKGSSAGGGYSTVEDMLKFANALHERKLRLPDFSKPPASGKQEKRGMVSGSPDGMGIAGGAPGINADFSTGVAGHYTVIVMANYDPPTASNAGKGIRQALSQIAKD